MNTNVLYITYDGLLDPLGQSQIWPYIRELARRGTNIRLISFEKPELAVGDSLERIRAKLLETGVVWRPLRYHRRPTLPATAWDILRGTLLARSIARREKIDIVHARSYIAGIIALAVKRTAGVRFLFDMRGFWPDERVEGGSWKKNGALYRSMKFVERKLLAAADGIVTLTTRGADILKLDMLPAVRSDIPPVRVIPTCADLDLFRPSQHKSTRVESVRMVYLGSLGSWYMPEPMLEFFAALRDISPASTFRIVTGSDPSIVKQAAETAGVDSDTAEAISVYSVGHEQIPVELAESDCSIFFIRPTYSKRASCATKFAESLACGVPVIINSGVGDHDSHVQGRDIGVVLEKLDADQYRQAAARLLALLEDSQTSSRCRAAAEQDFSLAGAVECYLELYNELAGGEEER